LCLSKEVLLLLIRFSFRLQIKGGLYSPTNQIDQYAPFFRELLKLAGETVDR
jgi:hypothetical protein